MVLSVLCIALQYRAYLLAGISGVPLVKDVHDRHHLHRIAVAVFRIYIVLYGNKPNTESGKHIVHILSDLDIVSTEPRKVFYDYGIDDARFCIVQQSLDFRSVERRTRYAVVDIFAVDLA